ncbi:hypothetical protein AaE_010184 [Aphanomyces astaci]|uniref:Uncharacterized protein n=1 Tax=Aphanomyces astaci TaxID=112090 RepID=A0A6A5A330_APHAT|nr:hypothetical protein AaE_010184 [Aphanomyces astaci]
MGNTLRWLGNWLAANKWVRTPSGLLHGPPHYPSHQAREAENMGDWQLIDQNDRPVMGNTLRWLGNWLAANKWVRTPSGLLHGPPHYPSHQAREAENMRLEEEPHPVLQADYRDDTTHQRSETPNPRDTVSHRFGMSAPTCSESGHLNSRLGLHQTCTMSWLPDQHIYPPRKAQDIVITFNLPLAEVWHENDRQRSTNGTPYQPMIVVTGSWPMHGLHLSRLPLAGISTANLFLNYGGKTCNSVPANLGTSLHDGWAVPRYQLNPFWHIVRYGSPATCNDPWDRCSTRKDDAPAPGHRFRTFGNESTTTAAMAGPYAYWCICYKNSPGHRTMDALEATWNLHIPAGQLRMRHYSTIMYSSPPRWTGLTNTNKVDIFLGYIVSPDTNTSTLPTHWAQAL